MELVMLNDEIMPLGDAKISAHDRSVYFGDGVYEVIRAINGELFELGRHMDRFRYSLEQMDMLEKVDLEQIRGRVARALAESGLANSAVYFQISRGEAVRSHDYPSDWRPNFLLSVRGVEKRKSDTITAITHADWRWKRCDIKSLNLLANIMAKHAATSRGKGESILVDENQIVTEATSSSVLLVRGNELYTAPLTANILRGITRELLLEWASGIGLTVKEESFPLSAAFEADELMVTGTSTEVKAVVELDGKQISDGQVGKYTRKFQGLLTEALYG